MFLHVAYSYFKHYTVRLKMSSRSETCWLERRTAPESNCCTLFLGKRLDSLSDSEAPVYSICRHADMVHIREYPPRG